MVAPLSLVKPRVEKRKREREMNDSTFLAAEKCTTHAWACPQFSTALHVQSSPLQHSCTTAIHKYHKGGS